MSAAAAVAKKLMPLFDRVLVQVASQQILKQTLKQIL